MDKKHPSQNGLTQPHVHYSFLKTAAEGLLLSDEEFCSSVQDSPESDFESLSQERQYQLELQQRIRNSEELLNQSYYELEEDSLEEESLEKKPLNEQERQIQFELQQRIHSGEELMTQSYGELEEDSLEEDSLEEEPLSEPEESDVEEAQIPTGNNCGKEDCGSSNSSTKMEITDRYSVLRYNPNWKNEGEGIAELKKSPTEDAQGAPFPSLTLTCNPPQERLMDTDHNHREGQQEVPSLSVSLNSCAQPASVSDGSYQSPKNREPEGSRYSSSSSICSDGSSAQTKGFNQKRSKKDFVRRNKNTLGLTTQQNDSYLQHYSKKQREGCPGQDHQCKRPEMKGTNSSQGPTLKESPVHCPLGAQVELRDQHGEHHNELEFENTPTNSNSYRELTSLEQDRRSLSYPPVAVLWPSVASGNQAIPLHACPIYLVHPDDKGISMNLTFARNPLQPSSCPRSPVFHLSSIGENSKKYHENLLNLSGYQQHSPCSCAVSDPHCLARHGKHQKPLGHKNRSPAYDSGFPQPVNDRLSDRNSRSIYREDIGSNCVSGGLGPAQPHARNVLRAPSPTECLIQAAERHLRDICQLADDHLAGMFHLPPLIQRGESDSQLDLESSKESQTGLNRSNSEGYLLQMEKQNEKQERKSRKGSRIKGYMKMDVKLGGLGPDHETIKEKAEKIKQQKEYAKQIKEHNRRNSINARKPSAISENKLAASRQKALEYAKTITKPKIVRSKPPEQEPKDEKNPAHTLNGENLPPISSLESLQNRHEREKQVVAAFKTLHIV
ncbi:jhy protein homolog [Eublepharis macularius]|uniref:Jhy protein homolog n=1 Tax=Eublepharis macularius TaxID=481883 RepID=A0AA97KDQ9_EUBMA|nr:jhy protein homolog [Eublepharis macularius]